MERTYDDILDLEEATELNCIAKSLSQTAFKSGFNYEQIYTALHKILDLALYEFELAIDLPDENSI